jgi:hypothetical protein
MVGSFPSKILNLTAALTEIRFSFRRSMGRQNLLRILIIAYPLLGVNQIVKPEKIIDVSAHV